MHESHVTARVLIAALKYPAKYLVNGGGGLRLREHAKAGGIEDIGFYFAFVALSGDFLAVQLEADACGVSCLDHDFSAGANRSVRGRDEGFMGYGFAIGRDGDPAGLVGADEHTEGDGRVGWSGGGGSSFGALLKYGIGGR